jgi:hypothetical protein
MQLLQSKEVSSWVYVHKFSLLINDHLTGSDNTAATLTLVFFYLLSHPLDYELLRAELDHAFPDPTGYLDMAKLTDLTFLNGVINETLRLGTPFFLPRVVPPSGAIISNQFIPSGTIIALAAYSQQTSAENFYPDPLVRKAHIGRRYSSNYGFCRNFALEDGALGASAKAQSRRKLPSRHSLLVRNDLYSDIVPCD